MMVAKVTRAASFLRCTRCGETKPAPESFGIRCDTGRAHSWCRACRNACTAAGKARRAKPRRAHAPAQPKPQAPPQMARLEHARHSQCQWPLWDDATPRRERRYCGNPVDIGSSWCAFHHARVTARHKGEAA